MKFSLLVLAEPASEGARTASEFAQAIIASGHELYRVFFYGEGTLNADAGNPEVSRWQSVQQSAQQQTMLTSPASSDCPPQAELIVCSTSAERCGLSAAAEGRGLAAGFELAGLGQLIDATRHSDRVVTFS